MSLNMQINDEDCIRYLMREMDPSEEIEFEREMMSNENLLIEVESLRSTYNKVKKLPLKQTPAEILEKVKKQAVSDQQKQLRSSFKLIGWFGKTVAVAATILLLISVSVYFIDFGTLTSSPAQSTVISAGTVQPWVDRNEIIKISDRTDAIQAQRIGADYEQSYEKLIPVNKVVIPSNQRQGVLLTSSPVNN
ncbi:MAG: hypothetical protein RLO03_09610 [Balneola sp.]|tara:strand:- start:109937 stop:110512 length:576 start_codon:yes stop_codon:yes gene_type:complete